jgi:uncharacterized membrane protein
MRRFPLVALFGALLLAAAGAGALTASTTAAPPIGECPLLPWETVNPRIFLDQGDARTYFCCSRCLRDWIQADPIRLRDALARAARAGDDLDQVLGGEYCQSKVPDGGATLHSARGATMDALARLHPATVHFPIAFFLAAALAEVLLLWRGGAFWKDGARFCTWAGAVTAPVAAATGWSAGGWVAFPGDLAGILRLHKWVGTGVAVAGLVCALLVELATRRDSDALRNLFRVVLVATAAAVAVAGYLGGLMVYGPDHYTV